MNAEFAKDFINAQSEILTLPKDNKGYNMCREFAEKNGMEIINLTHGGAIENFERQNFYDIFKK